MTLRHPRTGRSPAGPGEPGEEATLSDLAQQAAAATRRRYRVFLLCALAGAVAALALVVQLDKRYQSTLLLMVEAPARSPIDAEQPPAAALDAFVEGQVYIVESSDVLRAVLKREELIDHPYFRQQPPSVLRSAINAVKEVLGLNPPQTGEEAAMDPAEAGALRNLRRNLAVERQGATNVIRIDLTADTPRTAARVATAIGEIYSESRSRSHLDRATMMAGWLDNRALELQRQLAEAEDAVAAFRIKHNLMSGEPGQPLADQQVSELGTELVRTRAERAEREAAYNRALEVLKAGGDMQSLPEIQGSDIVMGLRTQLLDLERRENDLGGRGGTYPRLAELSGQRAALEAQLEVEIGRIVQVMGNEVENLQAREELLTQALAEAGGESGTASLLNVQVRELERRAEAYRALYERYLNSAGLADEAASFLPSGVEIIDAASLPNEPVFPPTKVIVLFGFLLGGGLGALVASVLDALRRGYLTVRNAEDDLGLPVLVCMPRLEGPLSAFDLTMKQPYAPFVEAVRTLRHALGGAQPSGAGRVLLLTSATAGEGKTNLAAALAASAYTAGLRVLLIDADFRQAGLTRLFGMTEDEGLAEALRGGTWALPPPGQTAELDILPVGAVVQSPADLLAGERMKRYLAEARGSYDLVILDGPPVANLADAPILARNADGVGFVIRWNDTPRDVVRKAIDRFGTERVTGLVLNAVDFTVTAQYGESYESYVQDTARPVRQRRDATA